LSEKNIVGKNNKSEFQSSPKARESCNLQKMKIVWKIKTFEELTNVELYAIVQLRLAVFSVEQNCPYQDADGKDLKSFHLMGMDESAELVAYSRIVPAGISFNEVSIGRVVTSQKVRGTGTGKELMKNSIQFIKKQFGKTPIRIGAQCYLIKFYSEFGFEIASEKYLEDNIPHIEMVFNT
jgi:ElaA protein